MSRFLPVSEPSILPQAPASTVGLSASTEPQKSPQPSVTTLPALGRKRKTFTGAIGAACMYPLRAIINLCVALKIHPNTLTLIGVLINVGAAWALAYGRFRLAFT